MGKKTIKLTVISFFISDIGLTLPTRNLRNMPGSQRTSLSGGTGGAPNAKDIIIIDISVAVRDKSWQIWKQGIGQLLHSFKIDERPIGACAVSDKFVATGGSHRVIYLCQVNDASQPSRHIERFLGWAGIIMHSMGAEYFEEEPLQGTPDEGVHFLNHFDLITLYC